MSDKTDDGVAQPENKEPKSPADVNVDNEEVESPSETKTSDNELSRRKKRELEREKENESLREEVSKLNEIVQPLVKNKALESVATEFEVDLNSIDRQSFDKEFETLKESGLDLKSAAETALRLIGVTKKAKEDLERSEKRSSAKLPPHGTVSPQQMTYTMEQINSISDDVEHNRIMGLVDDGKVKIVQ